MGGYAEYGATMAPESKWIFQRFVHAYQSKQHRKQWDHNIMLKGKLKLLSLRPHQQRRPSAKRISRLCLKKWRMSMSMKIVVWRHQLSRERKKRERTKKKRLLSTQLSIHPRRRKREGRKRS